MISVGLSSGVLLERRVRIHRAVTRFLERREVVAVAHPHERFAAIVHLLQVFQPVEHRVERHVRAIADLTRPARTARAVDDLGRLQLVAGHLVDRFVDLAFVVRHVHGN